MTTLNLKINKLKKDSKNQFELSVEAPAELSGKHYMLALRDISNKIDVPGFRKGKVPRNIVEKQVGVGYISQRAFESVFYYILAQAALQEKLDIVDVVEISSFELLPEKPLTFSVLVEIRPEVKLGKYKDLKVKAKNISYDKELFVKKTLDRIANNFVTYNKSSDSKVKEGDLVTIDFEGKFEDGTEVPGGKAENFKAVLDRDKFLPEFVDKLKGSKEGDCKEILITFPENYSTGFSDKKATFNVKVSLIEEKVLPAIDDGLAKQVDMENLVMLKDKVLENMIEIQESASKREFENNLVEEIVKSSKFELSDSMIEKETNFLLKDVKAQCEKNNVKWDEFKNDQKNNELFEKTREAAIKRISIDLVLNAIIKKEELSVSSEDLGKELTSRINQMGEKYKYLENDSSFRNTVEMVLLRNKAVDFLLQNNQALWEESKTDIPE